MLAKISWLFEILVKIMISMDFVQILKISPKNPIDKRSLVAIVPRGHPQTEKCNRKKAFSTGADRAHVRQCAYIENDGAKKCKGEW